MNCLWNIYTLFLLVVLLYVTSRSYASDLFTSTDRLHDLSIIEERSLPELEQVTNQLQQRISLLKSIVEEIKDGNNTVEDEESLVSHPVHMYNVIKRWKSLHKLFVDKQVHYDIRTLADTSKSNKESQCVDHANACRYWANTGECLKNPKYMLRDCRKSCEVCSMEKVTDHIDTMLDIVFDKFVGEDKNIFPYSTDFEGSADGIIRLQRTYDLKTEDLIQGMINGYKSVTPLNSDDMHFIGVRAVTLGEWGYGTQWLSKALELNKDRSKQLAIQIPLARAYMQMKDYFRASEIINMAAGEHLQVREYELTEMLFQINRKIVEAGGVQKMESKPEQSKIRVAQYQGKEKYEQLCRGDPVKQYPSKRVCRYRQAGSPWYVYKEEILNMNPRISMVYEVINDKEAAMFKEKAKHLMFRALVGKEHRTSNDRVSNVGWLKDDDPDIMRLSERVELITGMEVTLTAPYDDNKLRESSDNFQVVNYGIGGQYEPHVDYFVGQPLEGTSIGETVLASGGRISTFLLYLTDVKAGGATVYPKVGVHVPPIKNAAAFWFNSRLSGKYDPLTLHAGCPVLLGEKWVSNKWVREFGNEFKRKCGLTKNAKYS